jgi:hypothetical protein
VREPTACGVGMPPPAVAGCADDSRADDFGSARAGLIDPSTTRSTATRSTSVSRSSSSTTQKNSDAPRTKCLQLAPPPYAQGIDDPQRRPSGATPTVPGRPRRVKDFLPRRRLRRWSHGSRERDSVRALTSREGLLDPLPARPALGRGAHRIRQSSHATPRSAHPRARIQAASSSQDARRRTRRPPA